MKALITGASGFLGSHLTSALIDAGYDVRAMAHYRGDGSVGFLDEIPDRGAGREFEVVRGDVLDAEALVRHARGCDVIFNLAALGNPAYSVANPRHVFEVNTTGAFNALEAARATGARLVQMSTSEAYGTSGMALCESHPLNPRSPYGASKAAADAFCSAHSLSYEGLEVVIARCFNVYGPRQSARALIPSVMLQILRWENPASGDPVPVKLGTLTAERDYTYVTDTCAALIALARAPVHPGPVNVASGETRSLRDIALMCGVVLSKLVGTGPVRIEHEPAHERPHKSEVERLLGDASLLRELTGWEPKVSFEEGLRSTAEWVERHEADFPDGAGSVLT